MRAVAPALEATLFSAILVGFLLSVSLLLSNMLNSIGSERERILMRYSAGTLAISALKVYTNGGFLSFSPEADGIYCLTNKSALVRYGDIKEIQKFPLAIPAKGCAYSYGGARLCLKKENNIVILENC